MSEAIKVGINSRQQISLQFHHLIQFTIVNTEVNSPIFIFHKDNRTCPGFITGLNDIIIKNKNDLRLNVLYLCLDLPAGQLLGERSVFYIDSMCGGKCSAQRFVSARKHITVLMKKFLKTLLVASLLDTRSA